MGKKAIIEKEGSEKSITVDGNSRSPSIWIKHSIGIREHWTLGTFCLI
jgi:hypothetical protein